MFRRALFERHGLRYWHEFATAEDYELWTRALRHTRAAGVAAPLLDYRVHRERITHRRAARQRAVTRRIRRGVLCEVLGRAPSELALSLSGFEAPPPAGADVSVLPDLFAALRRSYAGLGPDALARLDALLARLRARP